LAPHVEAECTMSRWEPKLRLAFRELEWVRGEGRSAALFPCRHLTAYLFATDDEAEAFIAKRQMCVQRSDWNGHVNTTKGGRLRYVPLTSRLAAALRKHRHLRSPRVLCHADGSPLTRQFIQSRVRSAARRANVEKGVHILRHTFCSHFAMRGAPARAIQELAGHQDLGTTQRYMHLSPAAIEGAIRLLDQRSGGKSFGDILETADA
jgi:integrase